MFTSNIDPVFFNLGPLEIRYYGIIYALGFIIAFFMLKHLSKIKKIDFSEEVLDNYIIYLVVGVVLGARIFHILFYGLNYYLTNPLEIIAVWHGGLSFHGGLVGALIAGWIFHKKHKIPFLKLADITVIPASLALALGRIGNFINAELYGKITDLSWCINFPNIAGCRHPTQIYESLAYFGLFLILWNLRNKNPPKGHYLAAFLILYSISRFLLEFTKEIDIIALGLTMGQLLSIPMFLLGIYIFTKYSEREN
ncbi:prolipoprotein diacylglyceryl transferase [Candidatus Woesearchaeota archaeon]|nr:prolipoprotein diacylglyceryl transferase [Candidatus Woesearchaeota archaeon]